MEVGRGGIRSQLSCASDREGGDGREAREAVKNETKN